MGLFSDLFGSSSHSQTTTSTSQVTNTQLSGGPLSGVVAYGTGNTIVAADAGTVKAATDISHAALALGQSALDTEAQVSISGLDTVAAFSGSALDKVARFSSSALDANTYLTGKLLDAQTQAYSDSLANVSNANAKALAAVEDIASQVSQSSQQTTDTTVQKIVVYLVLGVVAVLVLPRLK